jgi:hypothetical protein
MRKSNMRTGLIAVATSLFMLSLLPATTQAGTAVKARLSSPNASEEASGTLMLTGYDLTGHLTGGGIDVEITGTVKNSGISVIVRGHIMPSCNLNQQTMTGDGENQGPGTSISLAFSCVTKAGNFGGGQDYLFRLDLDVPARHLQFPTGAGPGESAAINPASSEVQRNLA